MWDRLLESLHSTNTSTLYFEAVNIQVLFPTDYNKARVIKNKLY